MREELFWNKLIRENIRHSAEKKKSLIEGQGTRRLFPVNLDNLIFLPAQIKKVPLLETEEVKTETIIGPVSKKPISLKTPIIIAAISFGAVSKEVKIALAKGAAKAGTLTNTGEGGMLTEERKEAWKLTIQYSTGRFGIAKTVLKKADMIEIKIGQGAKPALGGYLPSSKIDSEIAKIRKIESGKDLVSPSRHLDINSAKDLSRKIRELRDLTEGVPIAVKIAGGHVIDDLEALFSQKDIPDVLVIDGGEGGTGAAPIYAKDHIGLPLLYFLPKVVEFFEKEKLFGKVTLIAGGGIRNGVDAAKVLALGADGVEMATSFLIAMGCIQCRKCHTGKCPAGIATQDEELRRRFIGIDKAADRVANFIKTETEVIKNIARICGKDDIHQLDRNDLLALDELTSKIIKIQFYD